NKNTDSPSPVEGHISYDNASKTHTSNNDILDTTLNIGDEQRVRVINKTGLDIEDGKALKQIGIDATTGLPLVDLAQADVVENSIVLCMSTHVILDGDEGIGTTGGTVNDIDTSSLIPGLVYLDASVAGGFTSVAPDVVTVLGLALTLDALEGSLYVEIVRIVSLPTLFAVMKTINDSYNLTTSYQDLINYQDGATLGLSINLSLGTIGLLQEGTYRATFNITITVPTSISTRSFTINIRNTVAATDEITYVVPIPRDTTEISRSFAIPFTVADGDILVAQIKSDVSISGVTVDNISFDVQSINVSI
ncbi:hypothetical protein KAR91_71450, partial [Candidatus Pacearchaeota archaeon]|nr:hypothetical protein [Candidatus Pacearchaeota archaeon]